MQFLIPFDYQNDCGIYKISNTVNGKVYVGSTKNFFARYHQHKSALKKCKHHSQKLQRATLKYGIENFIFELLEICSESLLIEREQFHIDFLKSKTCGYNVCPHSGTNRGYKWTEQQKQAVRGRKLTTDHIKAYVAGRKKLTASGHIMSQSKPVNQLDFDGTVIKKWPSVTHAVKAGFNSVFAVIGGKPGRSSAHGFKWEYANKKKESTVNDDVENTDEIWRAIPGYESRYQISNLGRVKALHKRLTCNAKNGNQVRDYPERILKPYVSRGKNSIKLNINGTARQFYINDLLTSVFRDLAA